MSYAKTQNKKEQKKVLSIQQQTLKNGVKNATPLPCSNCNCPLYIPTYPGFRVSPLYTPDGEEGIFVKTDSPQFVCVVCKKPVGWKGENDEQTSREESNRAN